ncbi:hypothetical protein AwDysgo_16710 [Bacteroidales bacterium]|nr:hypothetical protein AwDysgo_16710 [Bacteroidales bacterium]
MIKYFLIAFSCALFAVSCNSAAGNKVEAGDAQDVVATLGAQSYVLDKDQSILKWKGFKPGGDNHGSLGIESGSLSIDGSTLVSGSFVLDMNAIVCESLTEAEGASKLVEHLHSADFFDVEKFPTGKFTITNVEELSKDANSALVKISGNLELKGIEKNITFEAQVVKEGDMFTATVPAFTIDRVQWGINYGSKNIFKDIKDKFINDEMEISMVIVAKIA